jgi:hypothetical protein
MIGHEIDARDGEELVRFVRSLGLHRYVAGRLHLVHAFAVEAAGDAPALAEAKAWAEGVLGDPEIDRGSKDERLLRRATDAELVAVLAAFWTPADGRAHERLRARLGEIGADTGAADALPFDEDREDDLFPVLVDAGWELWPLASLDPERHQGAIAAFGDALAWDVARFEEENAVPVPTSLHELPAMGATELLSAFDAEGAPRAPFVLWASGNETYLDYVLRGVLRAAKIAR